MSSAPRSDRCQEGQGALASRSLVVVVTETGKEVTAHGAEADNLGQGGLAGYHSGERTASTDVAIPGTS